LILYSSFRFVKENPAKKTTGFYTEGTMKVTGVRVRLSNEDVAKAYDVAIHVAKVCMDIRPCTLRNELNTDFISTPVAIGDTQR
jgi:hypothetical protein